MFKVRFFIISVFLFVACETPIKFSEAALKDVLETREGKTIEFRDVIEQYKGKKVFIDVWASWCKDCLKGMPKVKELQSENPEVEFLFLSLDTSISNWNNAIKKYNIKGEHFYITSGDDGAFKDFLNSNWIPRYMVLDEYGNISLFKATKITDKRIKEALQ